MATLGQQLKAAREAKGVSESDVGRDTKILTKLIVGMEADNFSDMAAPTYAKGFLRLYADYLGLDSEPLVDEYLEKHAPGRTPLINESSQLEQNSRHPAAFDVNLKWLPVNLHPKVWLGVLARLFSKASAKLTTGVLRRKEKRAEAAQKLENSDTVSRRRRALTDIPGTGPSLPAKDIRMIAGIAAAILVLVVLIVSISNCARRRAAEAPPAAAKPESARMLLDEPLPDLYLVEPGKIESSR